MSFATAPAAAHADLEGGCGGAASAARTFDFTGAAPEAARLAIAAALVDATRATVILKGSGTIVASPDCEPLINTTGNPGMATGGSGDCLTGIIASLAAQKYKPLDAARIGVFIHGRAGDLAGEQLGEMGMTAGDIVTYIPYALKVHTNN